MTLTYMDQNRTLSIRGLITKKNGNEISISESDVVMYSSYHGGFEGVLLGSVSAASFTLEINKVGRGYTPQDFDGARVRMEIGLLTNGVFIYSPFGTWYVDSCSAPEQSVTITLFGYDALGSKFEAEYTDSEGAYPTTIGSLVTAICTGAGVRLDRTDFPNAAVEIKEMPEWADGVTLRDVLSYCAICAGGFAQITHDGKLEILSFADGRTIPVGADRYTAFSLEGGDVFKFNAIEVMPSIDAEDYLRFAVDDSIPDNAANTIQLDYNPLLTKNIVNSVVTELKGCEATAGTLTWVGDPAVRCGDFFDVTMLDQMVVRIMATSLSFTFHGGLSCEVRCELPSVSTVSSPTYSTSVSQYDSDGNIRVTRIPGLDKKIVSATAGHFESLTADDITTDRLTTALLKAVEIRADNIDAESIETDVLTAIIAKITQATIDRIDSGTISTDALYAALATIAAAQITAANIDKANINWAEIQTLTTQIADITIAEIKKGNIEWANIETLYAAIAEIAVAEIQKADIKWADIERLNATIANIAVAKIKDATIQSAQIEDLNATVAKIVSADIKTADIDYAQIKDLLAQKAIITDGVGGSLLIDRLAVTSANMLGATIGNLVLKSEDGRYYAVVIGTDGTIHTEEVTVTAGEVAAGQTATGQQIVETTMNVRDLNAQNIKAQEAIIAEIFTSALTAGKITAGEAMIASAVIPELYVTTIRAIGESLELVNGRTNIIHRGETPPVNAGAGDLWVQPSTGALFQAASGGAGLPEFAIDEAGVLYYSYGEGQTVYALTLDENGDLYVDEAAPFAIAIGPEGQIIPWERVKDGELQAGIDENKEAIDGANKLIREQSAKITEMADAIDLRVTTEVYEEGLKGLGDLIQKNEASITLLDESITSRVSDQVKSETGEIREEVSEIKQTADEITLQVSNIEGSLSGKPTIYRQEQQPTNASINDIWINTKSGVAYVCVSKDGWASLAASSLDTSYIEIARNYIEIGSGGNLNVNTGAVHFNTSEYTLSILADNSSEETVMDFDAESKTLRVNEISAGNVRPFIPKVLDPYGNIIPILSSDVGGIEGLKGMLESAQYEHLIYKQTEPDYSVDTVVISGSNSLVVEIIADTLTQIPPLEFSGVTGNIHLKNMKWSVASENSSYAVAADSGSIMLRDCYIDGLAGIGASGHARMIWVGYGQDADSPMTTAGACNYAAIAVEGGDIKMNGLIPAGNIKELRGGTVRLIDTVTGAGGAGGAVNEYTTESIAGTIGYFGTGSGEGSGWNNNEIFQGYTKAKGQIYGCMKFNLSKVTREIKAATLTLHRVKRFGKSSGVDITIYGSASNYAIDSAPILYKDNNGNNIKYASRTRAIGGGESASFDVTTAANALRSNTIKQLVLYTGDSRVVDGYLYSVNYGKFDSATLKITY